MLRTANRLIVLLFALLLASCGDQGDSMPSEDAMAEVDTSSVPALDSRWQLQVSHGTVTSVKPSGEAWDAFGGAPDPLVCLEIGTTPPACTTTVFDSFAPVWNQTVQGSFTYAQLQDVNLVLFDEDVSDHDVIMGGNVAMELVAGQTQEYLVFVPGSVTEVVLILAPL